MEFAKEVARLRKRMFKSPRSFHKEAGIECSYYHYLKIEGGEKVSSAEIALQIIEALDIDRYKGLTLWMRDQLPDNKKDVFPLVERKKEEHDLHSISRPSQASTTVNRMQLGLLKKDPIYWDLLTYLNAYSHVEPRRTINNLSKEFTSTIATMRKILDEMYEWGLIDRNDDKTLYTAGEWVNVPYTEEFKSFRDKNLKLAFKRFWKSPVEKSFRTTHTRTLTKSQRDLFMNYVTEMLHRITAIPDDEDGEAYTLGLFSFKRGFAND